MLFFISPPFGNYIHLPKTIPIKGSYTLKPRYGLFSQISKTLRYSFHYNGWINKIGLRNPGIDYAIKQYQNNHIVSIAILNQKEIKPLLKKIPEDMNLEINISCPNTEHSLIHKDIHHFLNPKRRWCIIKLSPLIDKNLIDSYYQQGFRQFNCGNTLPIKEGGLSGSTLIPYHSKNIRYIKKTYPDTIVIATGGIRTWKDIQEYQSYGANHISVSTILFNPFQFFILYSKYYFNLK
jgi:dihydroorotate dehydrogenase